MMAGPNPGVMCDVLTKGLCLYESKPDEDPSAPAGKIPGRGMA